MRRHAGTHWVRARAEGSGSVRRAPLRIVGPRRRRLEQGRRNPIRLLHVVSVTLVLGSLLAVVVAQALLANGQVRLSALQHELTLEQSAHRQAELTVSELETPARIVAAASGQLHMVRPTQVMELPYVSLSTPLPTPKVTPAPAAAPAASSSAAAAASAETASTGGTTTAGATTGASSTTGTTGASGTGSTTQTTTSTP